jgi:hypothetical protein
MVSERKVERLWRVCKRESIAAMMAEDGPGAMAGMESFSIHGGRLLKAER